MVRILKEEMNCTEDLDKRRLITDSEIDKRSEVEAQYSAPYVPFALLLFVLLLLLLFILGLYQCVGFCVCVRAVSRLVMIVSD